ncbi:lipoprotein signal peptide [Xylanimonas cellulosilytica DSM 15894]|uniref:Lipoprotein signal peptide n=2 Tax=Xylanimonas TaxID=186188 RepID=D1BRP9_XYLCX|nr:lipoprotein signal peptide [Xylanimonas cellulosilytica DSM 15894]
MCLSAVWQPSHVPATMTRMPSAEPTVTLLHDPARLAYDGAGPRPVQVSQWRSAREDAPLVVLSHGTGGSVAELAWWATALRDAGFDVVGIDHHGNSYAAGTTALGFVCWWDRALDVSFVLDSVTARGPVGVAGFSLGGYTAGAVCGVRLSERVVDALFSGTFELPPPPEYPTLREELDELRDRTDPALAAALPRRAAADLRDPRVRAGFLLCPALGPVLDDAATATGVGVPVMVRWTAADTEAPPEVNGMRLTRAIRGAEGGPVGTPESGHYGFVIPAQDDPAAKADVVRDSLAFFTRTLTT